MLEAVRTVAHTLGRSGVLVGCMDAISAICAALADFS
ncbi:hypothetical protein M2323_004164 [Rhodoblastus acidophilus]|nr:hypothetical protein [Rhodoblastus acidophilus]MCW2335218.1 hypothetical protein [Rhodoblastus acidophilus]